MSDRDQPTESTDPHSPARKLCPPPLPRKVGGVKAKKAWGVGLGSVDSVDSVAIHSERGAYRDSLLVVSSRIVKRYKSKSLHAAPPVDMLLRSQRNHRRH